MVRLQEAELQDPDGSIRLHLEAFGTGNAGCEALAVPFTACAATSLALTRSSAALLLHHSGPLPDVCPGLPAIHQTGLGNRGMQK
jgi:hypothetical protein